ncbi:MAG: hypothetical protein HYZ38_27025 [Mycobacterium sp.]|nr:hypothetical protein [Mycobacterium sp.]
MTVKTAFGIITAAMAAGGIAMLGAPAPAQALPTCVTVGQLTTQCRTSGGSTQIITSPPMQYAGTGFGYPLIFAPGWGPGLS